MPIHNIRDAALKVTKACPTAGANHNTDTIDLGCKNPGASVESFEVEIAIPALPNLAAEKTLTVKLQDSDDNTTFDDVEQLASVVVTGVSTNGSAASTVVVRLPSDVKRYVQANLAVATGGGDNTAKSVVVSLLG
ncbi:MAG: hypothetical protein BWY92_01696 [Firmicutes bacterium ADurb.BinA052]|nr:MAG: hypothetical protein BWY92_01696 [Firmicutes bacterium ADurb.BinA052]